MEKNGYPIEPGEYLYRADLALAILSGENLSGADLTRADLTMANLNGADLTNANLLYANLTNEWAKTRPLRRTQSKCERSGRFLP